MKSRIIKDGFWSDTYVEDLDPIEKLLFLYLITNSQNNISGVYKIKHKRIAYETGIDKEMVEKIILRFEKSDKVRFFEDWIILKNFHKYQNYESPKILSGLQKIVDEFPNEIVEIIKDMWPSEIIEKLNLKFKKQQIINETNSQVTNWSKLFEEVWKQYDFKRNKKKSKEKFLTIIKNCKNPEEVSKKIFQGIRKYNQHLESLEKKQKYDSKVFVPQKQQLVFWLNNERWNDEYLIKKQVQNLDDVENY